LATCSKPSEGDLIGPRLSDLVNPLVITETGTLKPIAYDFNSYFDVASIDTLSQEKLAQYKRRSLLDLQVLIGSALAGLQSNDGLVDWFDYCTRLSEQAPVSRTAGRRQEQRARDIMTAASKAS
jgi:hypothetical protein